MPLPSPRDDESKEEWLSRCMGNDVMNSEFPKESTRYAVCQDIWDRKKGQNGYKEETDKSDL